MSDGILGTSRVWSGTGPWHLAWKLVKSLPMGSPSQDRDAGSNPAGATILISLKVFTGAAPANPDALEERLSSCGR